MTSSICCIVDFVIPTKGESLVAAYEKWRGWADEKGEIPTVTRASLSNTHVEG